MNRGRLRLLTMQAVLVAVGTISAQVLWFPVGIAKAYPIQHAINVLTAVVFGPGPAVTVAFLISCLRNMLGLGTLFAFPGSMIGALLAGYFYRKWRMASMAGLGEVIGTGIVGSLVSVPLARLFFGEEKAVFAFLPGFLVSSISGAVIGVWVAMNIVRIHRSSRSRLSSFDLFHHFFI